MLATAVSAEQAGGRDAALEAELSRIASAAHGTVGVAAVHLETGARASANGASRFPMMSVYKVPIALELLHRVERREVALDESVPIRPSDLRLGASPIAQAYSSPGIRKTLGELLDAMLADSDNTASDLVLRAAGGPSAVTRRLRELGIDGVRVDRSEGELALDYAGARDVPPPAEWTLERLRAVFGAVSPERRRAGARAFLEDPRDTATPEAMAQLLAAAFRGEALGPEATQRLIAPMSRSVLPRLGAKLPAGAGLAHKAGTSLTFEGVTAAVNDAGVVTVPGEAGHFAVAVFVKGTSAPVREAEETIARLARAVYDRWTPSAARSE